MFSSALIRLIKKHPEALSDRRVFSDLLNNYFPREQKKRYILLSLYELGIHTEIANTHTLSNQFANRFVKRLNDQYGIENENAYSGVYMWCMCYGNKILGKQCELSETYISIDDRDKTHKNEADKPINNKDNNVIRPDFNSKQPKTDNLEYRHNSHTRGKRFIAIIIVVIVVITSSYFLLGRYGLFQLYNDAVALLENGEYTEAIDAFISLGDYRDSVDLVQEANYRIATALLEQGLLDEAETAFIALGDYKDSPNMINEIAYRMASDMFFQGKYVDAIDAFSQLSEYKNSAQFVIEASYQYAVALLNDGRNFEAMTALGRLENYKDSNARYEQLVIELRTTLQSSISAGYYHTVVLKPDGSVEAIGLNDEGQCDVADWQNIIAVSAGLGKHTVGLKYDGHVLATGNNEEGQCDVEDWNNIVFVSAGFTHTVGIMGDSTVIATGLNDDGQCNVENWNDIISVSAGLYHTAGLKSDGTVVAVGSNEHGQCDVIDWQDIISVSAGGFYTIGLKADGTVVVTGLPIDEFLYPEDVWFDIIAISAGGNHSIGLKSDGTVVTTEMGRGFYGETDVNGWYDIIAVSAGGTYTIGLKSDGTFLAAGDNEFGQCDLSSWHEHKN